MVYETLMRCAMLFALCVLVACASPREACLRSAFSEVATLDRLIAESEANLARGYRIEPEPYVTTGIDFCIGRGVYDTGFNVGLSYCNTADTRYREREVAIDPVAERRTLADLRRKRSEAALVAETRVAACPAA